MCAFSMLVAACQLAGGLADPPAGSPPDGTDPLPGASPPPLSTASPTPSPTPRSVGDVLLARLTDPDLRIPFEVGGVITRDGVSTPIAGEMDLVGSSWDLALRLREPDGNRPAAARKTSAGTFVQMGFEVAWFDESADHDGPDLAAALQGIEALDALPDDLPDDGKVPFAARGVPAFVHVAPLTSGTSGSGARIQVIAAPDGSLRTIELIENWDGGGLELRLETTAWRREPKTIDDPWPILERYASKQLGYTMGIIPESRPTTIEDLPARMEGEGFFFGEGRYVAVFREDQRLTATMDSYARAFEEATRAGGATFQRSGVGTIAGSGIAIPTYILAPTTPDGTGTFIALFVHGRYGYQLLVDLGDAATSESFLMPIATTFRGLD